MVKLAIRVLAFVVSCLLVSCAFLSLSTYSSNVFASSSAGDIDTTFQTGTFPGTNHAVTQSVEQSDGNIIIVGDFTTYAGIQLNRVARIQSNGLLDTNFDIGTGADALVYQAVIQPDEKIILVGQFSTFNGVSSKGIIRLNSDGSIDTSFNSGVGITGMRIIAATLQSDGKIIIGGYFTAYQGVARTNIARLNSDGTLDTSFNPGTGTSTTVNTIVVQSTGKIVIGGPFTKYNGTTVGMIARLNSDGSLDGTFSSGTGFTGTAMWRFALQSDDKIVAGGYYSAYNGTGRNKIARLNADGTLDTSFTPGTGANAAVNSVFIDSEGKVLIGGYFDSYNGTTRHKVARLNTDGTLDSTFDPVVGIGNYSAGTIIELSSKKIFVGGNFATFNGYTRENVALLSSDGSFDQTFLGLTNTGLNNKVSRVLLQPDGNILVIGDFTSVSGVSRAQVVRFNSDGTLDTTFIPDVSFSTYLNTIDLQSDGKIIIGGDSDTGPFFVRLNTDGTEDTSFQTGTGFDGDIYQIIVQSDDKIIVGGLFNSYDGNTVDYLVRLNADGTIDSTFDMGTGLDDEVDALALQADGKIIIGGWFTGYNGTSVAGLARLNSDGSLDTDFSAGAGVDSVNAIQVLDDGKIIIVGPFETYDGTNVNYIARLNSDGSLDSTFLSGSGSNYEIDTVVIQSDGKILIGGAFTEYDGNSCDYFARLNADGSYDDTLNLTSDGTVFGIATQSDGNILIGGDFTSIDNTPAAYIARVYGSDEILDTTAPSGSIQINNGATSSDTRDVTVGLTATDDDSVTIMRVCENNTFVGCSWVTYNTTVSFALSSGNGIKTVYAEFSDPSGNISSIYSDTIELIEPNNVADEDDNSAVSVASTIKITITVVDSAGSVIEHAYVMLDSVNSGYTDSNGVIIFDGVTSGEKNITVTYEGDIVEKSINVLGTENVEEFIEIPDQDQLVDDVNTTQSTNQEEKMDETSPKSNWLKIASISSGCLLILIIIIAVLRKRSAVN